MISWRSLWWVGVVLLGAGSAGCNGCMGRDEARGSTGDLEPSAQALDFGPTTLGMLVERSVGLSQRGLLSAEVTDVRILPEDAPFTLLQALPDEIALDRGTEARLGYRPRKEGVHHATLVVELLDGDPVVVTLEGRGVDARAQPLDQIDFGRPALGTVRERALRLRNEHETPVPVTLDFDGPDRQEFAVVQQWLIPPYSEVEAKLRYEPRDRAGLRDVVLTLGACPLCLPEPLPVRADAVDRPLAVDPDPIDLGGIAVDADRVIEVRVTNLTDERITVHELSLGAGTDPGFELTSPKGPVVLEGLEQVTAPLRFSPTRLGLATGTFEVLSDARPEGRVQVQMRAVGGGSQLVVVPGRLDFKPIPVHARRALVLTITNGGADVASPPLLLSSVRVEGAGFAVGGNPSGRRLEAGERLEVEVAFEPDQQGPFSATLVVESDDPLTPRIDVPLTGAGTAAANCQLVTQPQVLDFGLVRAGKGASLGVRLENAGSEVCALWNQRLDGDDAFSLTRDRGTVLLAPGEAVYMPVAFRPQTDRSYEARLSFDTNRPQAALSIPLLGGATDTCLRPEPPYLSFGVRRLDCGPAELSGQWRNVCSNELTVEEIFLGDGADVASFSIVAATATPEALSRDETVQATVRWTPSVPGYTSRPLFAQPGDADRPVLLALSADVREDGLHDEARIQPAPAKVDLLWVVDNTASMKDEREGLMRSIGAFLSEADTRGIDYRVGVTTTGVGAPTAWNGEACHGGVNGNESGRLFPVDRARPRIVHPGLADRTSVLAANLDVGGCHSVEQGLLAAELALTSPLVNHADDARTPEPADGNFGLVRDDAHLAVVVVSDEDDESPDSVDRRARALRRAKPSSPFTFAAIVAPAEGCATAVEPGTRYLDAARQLGGLTGNVCDGDWSGTLNALADALFEPMVRWVLDAPADPATLSVTIDDVPTTAWRYDPGSHSVVFDQPPPSGSRLRFRYQEPCP